MTPAMMEALKDKRAEEEMRAYWAQHKARAGLRTVAPSTPIDARYEATLSVDFEDDGDSDRETK
jgi:hypothetical protein